MFAVALASLAIATAADAQPVELVHIHGLAYSSDGKRLLIPSHHGLAVYENGKWSRGPGPAHDYMGFSATADRFYSSGHPAPGTGLVNPFGLIRSRDGGKTWDKLGLEGETDFHLLASGWRSNAIYVWNDEPSSRMRRTGLHSTLNEGFAWKPAAAAGLQGKPQSLAVHPDDAAMVAVATSAGIFLSRDSGERFSRVAGKRGLSVVFDLDGRHLWYGTYDGRPHLLKMALQGGQTTEIRLPALKDDAVAYIAQNPKARDEYSIATFERSVYRSANAGRNWTRIADRGEAK